MILTKENANKIAQQIKDYLTGWTFCYLSTCTTRPDPLMTLEPNCELACDWTDGSTETVRVKQYEQDGEVYIAFSITGWYITLDEGTNCHIDYGDGVRLRYAAPCGDGRLCWMKRSQPIQTPERSQSDLQLRDFMGRRLVDLV